MGGVVSGTAILLPKTTNRLHTITLTINNKCNLHCPHCYLQYNSNSGLISRDIIEVLYKNKNKFKHLAITGKEPLVDRESAAICAELIDTLSDGSNTVSLMTNGLNLNILDKAAASKVSFIDMSLDGGYISYDAYRSSSIHKLENNIAAIRHYSTAGLNALNVLNGTTIHYIDDMMEFGLKQNFDTIMFSPYLPTENFGTNNVDFISLQQCMGALRKSSAFMKSEKSFFMVDIYHCWHENFSLDYAKYLAKSKGIFDKVYFVPEEPTILGVMRITYDGYALSSLDALHTVRYQQKGTLLTESADLTEYYNNFAVKANALVLERAA